MKFCVQTNERPPSLTDEIYILPFTLTPHLHTQPRLTHSNLTHPRVIAVHPIQGLLEIKDTHRPRVLQ